MVENTEMVQGNKKISFTNDVKFKKSHAAILPTNWETCFMCTIDGESFFMFLKHVWDGNSIASCHITHDDARMYDVIAIQKSIQGSSGNTKTTKREHFM